MTMLTFGVFVLLAGTVLLLLFEEKLAQLKKRVQSQGACLEQGIADEEHLQRTKLDESGNEWEGFQQEDIPGLAQHIVARSGGYLVDQFRLLSTEWQRPNRGERPSPESRGYDADCEDEPTERMLHQANNSTAAHAFRFPRAAGLSIRVHPPRDEGHSKIPQKNSNGHAKLLRVHDGYMFIEDRLLRFKSDGGRKKSYEAWHESKWRPAKRQELWIRNEDGEREHVKLMCVLDSSDFWTPLRVRDYGWVECS